MDLRNVCASYTWVTRKNAVLRGQRYYTVVTNCTCLGILVVKSVLTYYRMRCTKRSLCNNNCRYQNYEITIYNARSIVLSHYLYLSVTRSLFLHAISSG